MKKELFLFIFITFLITGLSTKNLLASFENVATGARQAGMAESFAAIADDSYTILHNPAGLTNIKRIEFASIYSQLYPGLTDDINLADQSVAFAFPINKNNSIGIAWYGRQLSGLYSEDTLIMGYSHKLWNVLNTGINLKMRQKGYISNEWTSINDIFNQGKTALNYTLDLGILYNLNRNSIGLSILDITQPNMGIWEKSIIPLTLKLGYAYEFTSNIKASIDSTYQNRYYKIHSGVENWSNYPFRNIFWRMGIGIGNDKYRLIALGLGYRYNKNPIFQIDYAFNYSLSGIKKTIGTHLISLSTKFGQNRHLTKQKRETIRRQQQKEKEKELKIKKEFQTAQNHYNNRRYITAHESFSEILKMKSKRQRIKKGCRKYIELIIQQIKQMEHPPECYYAQGFIHYTKGEFQNAIKKWNKLTILYPQFNETQVYIEKTKDILKKNKERKIAERERKAKELFKTGKRLFDKGLYSESILYFKTAYKWIPDEKTKIYVERAKIKINAQQKRQKYTFKREIDKPTTEQGENYNKETTKKINQLIDEGIIEYRLEHYKNAWEKFNEVLKIDPHNYKVALYRDRTENKIKLGKEYINKDQEDKLYREAMEKYLKGSLKEAIKLWEEILTINPNNEKALNNLIRARKELETKENHDH